MQGIDRRSLQNFDWMLLALTAALVAVGFVNLFSSTHAGTELSAEVRRQLFSLAVGGVALVVTVVVEIVINAERSGNTVGNVGVISSRTFSYPVRVCSGCLIDCTSCPNGECPAEPGNYLGGVCGNAQDSALVPAACGDEA